MNEDYETADNEDNLLDEENPRNSEFSNACMLRLRVPNLLHKLYSPIILILHQSYRGWIPPCTLLATTA